MSVSRPQPLHVGDRIRFEGAVHTIVGLEGTSAILADQQGSSRTVTVTELLVSDGFTVVGRADRAPLANSSALSGVPVESIEQALWWERHLVEVLTGSPCGAESKEAARPEYDPFQRTLTEREQAKAEELNVAGHDRTTARTIQKKRRSYESHGLAGLVDGRLNRQYPDSGRTDPRVMEVLREAVTEAAESSTRTAQYYFRRLPELLAERYGEGVVEMPSRPTFYRLFEKVTRGRHTTGSARTRRSLANRPQAPFGQVSAARPGELVQIDSTPLDVMVLLDRGVPGRVDLTVMVDLATRTLIAATLAPTTKSVDASALLARAVTPELMRPGWRDVLHLARSVMPYQRMLDIDERLEAAAARPVILPETIVCDRGNVYLSQNFRSACAALGINFQPAHPGTPTDKPHIERTLESVATLFFQHVSGYLGRSAEHRGTNVDSGRLWSIHEMQELLDEWVVAEWQNRPHDGLRDPSAPGRAFTPNEKYASLIQAAGYLPVALSADDYIELLPAQWRTVNAYGIKLRHRTYDSAELNRIRGERSGVKSKKDLWEVHYDPYDITRVWVRDHWRRGWITVPWKHIGSSPVPFGEVAWDHAIRTLRDQGEGVDEESIAGAVRELLQRASSGPQEEDMGERFSQRERRVLAREHATARQPVPEPNPEPAFSEAAVSAEEEEEDFDNVVPLKVFDARKAAEEW